MVYDWGLDKHSMIPNRPLKGSGNMSVYNAFLLEGSLNTLATTISKVAALEGIEFPTMVDERGADELMRVAAGLTNG